MQINSKITGYEFFAIAQIYLNRLNWLKVIALDETEIDVRRQSAYGLWMTMMGRVDQLKKHVYGKH